MDIVFELTTLSETYPYDLHGENLSARPNAWVFFEGEELRQWAMYLVVFYMRNNNYSDEILNLLNEKI